MIKRHLILTASLIGAMATPATASAASEFLAAQSQSPSVTSRLTLKVEGIKKREGSLRIGLYNSETGFEAEDDFQGKTVRVKSNRMKITFKDLPPGEYALKIFHDEDNDGKLDTDFLGIPSEPYGFSNNASDPFSAPEWEETKFSVPRGRMTTTIDLD